MQGVRVFIILSVVALVSLPWGSLGCELQDSCKKCVTQRCVYVIDGLKSGLSLCYPFETLDLESNNQTRLILTQVECGSEMSLHDSRGRHTEEMLRHYRDDSEKHLDGDRSKGHNLNPDLSEILLEDTPSQENDNKTMVVARSENKDAWVRVMAYSGSVLILVIIGAIGFGFYLVRRMRSRFFEVDRSWEFRPTHYSDGDEPGALWSRPFFEDRYQESMV